MTPEITADPDGFAIWFDLQKVDVFPTWDGAAAGMRAARRAIEEMDRLFPQPTDNEVGMGLPGKRYADAGPYPRSPQPQHYNDRKGL